MKRSKKLNKVQKIERGGPIPNTLDERSLSTISGSATGEADRAVEAGGWQGTDDATSTAPSDTTQDPKTKDKPIEEDLRIFHSRG